MTIIIGIFFDIESLLKVKYLQIYRYYLNKYVIIVKMLCYIIVEKLKECDSLCDIGIVKY